MFYPVYTILSIIFLFAFRNYSGRFFQNFWTQIANFVLHNIVNFQILYNKIVLITNWIFFFEAPKSENTKNDTLINANWKASLYENNILITVNFQKQETCILIKCGLRVINEYLIKYYKIENLKILYLAQK